ncbi:hypothetical protein O3M35_002029 [Rhynocoris fuscipes]|uniref:Uncharacterized protein n=1 Tax=Rhynocoris fuscipes TaxID=488301 RepID=A0AAW1CW61_9HEMI
MVGTIFCTVLWFAVLDDLEYFTVYYIWPIDAMFSIAILVLRIIQHGYRIQKRMTFESIDIGLDLAGFIGSVIAAIFAYREFHSKRVSAALWKFSILTATVHLLDFWLLVDYSEEKRVCCAG